MKIFPKLPEIESLNDRQIIIRHEVERDEEEMKILEKEGFIKVTLIFSRREYVKWKKLRTLLKENNLEDNLHEAVFLTPNSNEDPTL